MSFSIDCQVLVLTTLNDKVGHDAAIIGVHAWSKGVEDTRDSYIHIVLVLVRIHHGFSNTLAFVVAGTWANSVDIAPVGLRLRVHFGVSVNLGCGGQKDASLDAFGQTQHVESTNGRRLDGFNGVVLVMRRRSRAGEVINLINFDSDWFSNIMNNEAKVWVEQPVLNVLLLTGEEVVEDSD